VTMAMGFGEIWGGKFWALASPFSFSFFLFFSFFRFPPEDAATHACAAAPGACVCSTHGTGLRRSLDCLRRRKRWSQRVRSDSKPSDAAVGGPLHILNGPTDSHPFLQNSPHLFAIPLHPVFRCAPAPPQRAWCITATPPRPHCHGMLHHGSLYLARPSARLHRSLSRQLAPARARKWQGSEQSSLHDGRTRSRLQRRHPAMQTRLNMVIPPRSADSPSSADSPNSADLPSSGDDAGGEDVVGWRRPPRVAVRKVSMRKIGQPSSSRGTPSNIGVKQSPLKKFCKLQCGVKQSPLEKGCELQGMSAM
jgi:hypothetical protein